MCSKALEILIHSILEFHLSLGGDTFAFRESESFSELNVKKICWVYLLD